MVIVRCDRALEWNARGTTVAIEKKLATTVSHQFFHPRAYFHSKTAAHSAVAVMGGQRSRFTAKPWHAPHDPPPMRNMQIMQIMQIMRNPNTTRRKPAPVG